MSYTNNFHADDSLIDHSWSLIYWLRKDFGKWVVRALVANDGFLIVSCSVKAIIHGRLFLFHCSPETQLVWWNSNYQELKLHICQNHY